MTVNTFSTIMNKTILGGIYMVSSIDVAKKANVSQSTVSRVLNNPEKVNPKTRKKVLAVIKELNYRPNLIARSLVSKETRSITLISGPLHNPFFADSATEIVSFANKKGFNINVIFDDLHDNVSVYEEVLNQQIDGLILSSMFYNDPVHDELVNKGIPYVMFNRKHKNNGNFVEIDNKKAGFMATEYLIQHNHKDISWLGGTLSTSTFYGRHQGYIEAFKKYGIPINKDNTIVTDTTQKDVHDKLINLIARKNRPTAIVAATDSIALYVMDILGKNGYNIPEDISVIGIDNVNYSAHHSINLTTVGSVDDKYISKLAIEYLIDLINKKDNTTGVIQETVDVTMFSRGTVKKI